MKITEVPLKKRLMFAAAAALGLSLIAGPASAQDMGRHGDHSPFFMLLSAANLSAEQKSQVQQILQSDRSQSRSLYQQYEAIHQQISARLVGTGNVSASQLTPLVQQAAQIRESIDENRMQTALQIRGILTPEQLSKLASVEQQLQAMHTQLHNLMGRSGSSAGE
jgi:Spy/CpxP family protein refolding chaperone